MIVIHDGNWQRFAESVHTNAPYLCGTFPRLSERGSLSYARPYAEVMDLIPKSQWASRYDAMIGKFARQKMDSFKPALHDQGPHPLCWAYSLAQHFECVRANMGLPYIQLAPESITGTTGYRDVGWMLDRALEWSAQHGMAPRLSVPQYNLRPNTWQPGWEQAALNVVPLERFDLGTKDMEAEIMTALVSGEAVYDAYNFLGHAMNMEELQKKGNEYGFWNRNTWGAGRDMLMFGSKKIPDEAYVVRQVTYSR